MGSTFDGDVTGGRINAKSRIRKRQGTKAAKILTAPGQTNDLKCVQRKLDIAGTAIEMHLLLF